LLYRTRARRHVTIPADAIEIQEFKPERVFQRLAASLVDLVRFAVPLEIRIQVVAHLARVKSDMPPVHSI
ncbi:MAG: hypothetical protein WCB94_02345, partial [Terriglobales bacterium]